MFKLSEGNIINTILETSNEARHQNLQFLLLLFR